jgi:filamentous hemagglutinin family protein
MNINEKLYFCCVFVVLCFFPLVSAQAQIQTDGSLGSAQKLSGPDYIIDESLGQRAGNNLFHSFSEFNIGRGESATFRGANEITNVISRVTGGKLSTIDGLLRSEIKNANFYLINSAGVLFGPNARLSIDGSFHTSTADNVRFGNADLFYSEPLQGEILSTAAPAAFGFLVAPRGTITVAGSQLDLEDGATVSLVGADVIIEDEARISIPRGQINVVGVNSAGEAFFDISSGFNDLDASAFTELKDVKVLDNSELNVDGDGGGRVVIRSRQLTLEESYVSAQTTGKQGGKGIDLAADHFRFKRSKINTTTTGSGTAGDILIDANTLVLDGLHDSKGVGIFANSAASNSTNTSQNGVNSGKAGTVIIRANQVDVLGEVAIETTSILPENTGTIDLLSSELSLNGFDADFQVNSGKGVPVRRAGSRIVFDGRLNPGGVTAPDLDPKDSTIYWIEADDGEIFGKNLFYSFRDFLVDNGETALFKKSEHTENVANIITRVTGNTITSIYGNLESEIPGASLYLINPNGVFFGSDSALSLPGSFHIGTADYLTLTDGGRFDVSDPAHSVLNSGDLSAYGFTDNEIGEITIEGSRPGLRENSVFSLIGGNIWLTKKGGLLAPFGHINLVSLKSSGEASVLHGSNDLDVSQFSALGDIVMNDNAVAAVDDETNPDGNPGGRIFIRSNDLILDNTGRLRARNTTAEDAGGSIDVLISGDLLIGKNSDISIDGEGELGQITITAGNVTIDALGQDRFTGINVLQKGKAGSSERNLRVTVAENLNLINGGTINLANYSEYDGGKTRIQTKNLTIEGRGSDFVGIFSAAASTGNGGELDINVEEHLQILNGGAIDLSTAKTGNGGVVKIQAKNLTIDSLDDDFAGIGSVANPGATGNGGELYINVEEHLQILNNGVIDVSTASSGNGGSARIQAKDLTIDGRGAGFAGIGSVAVSGSTGNGGELDITVEEHLQILGSGVISVSTESAGNAGSARIQAKDLTIDGRGADFAGIGSVAVPGSTGNGGELDITVDEHLQILSSGVINVSTESAGNAGSARIQAKDLTIDGRGSGFAGIGSVADSDFNSNGGNLDIKITESLKIINGGEISAFAKRGNAGNLSISAGGNIYIADSSLDISAGQEDFNVNDLSNFLTPELFVEAGDSIYIRNSILSTNAGVLGSERGAGGDIYLQAPVEIWLENSILLAQAGYTGGNVYIDPIRYIVISSDVIAQADVQGGNYQVIVTKPSGWIQSTDSQINLSGKQSGSVLSNTSPFDLGAELIELNLDFLNLNKWVSLPCKFRPVDSGSSFVVTSWRGVSDNIDDFLPSKPILLADYNISETETIDEKILQKAIFSDLEDGCENCP